MDTKQKLFGKHFLWGASTASHQVEGGTVNQWSEWEHQQASNLSKSARRRLHWLPEWPRVHVQAQDPENYISGEGVDHYNRYQEDFALAKQLHLNAFRFGIEWSRIEPEPGVFDEAAIEHYQRYIAALKEQDLEPFLNIWHWTMPTWFTNKGGFAKKENLADFDRFVEVVATRLCRDVHYVITLNEPNVYASFSYLMGEWPPQQKSVLTFLRVYWNLSQAHKRAYKILKSHKSSLQVGIAAQLANIQAKRPRNILDVLSTQWMRYAWNWWFINRINRYQDFVGFNYYFTDYYRGFLKKQNPMVPVNDLGWYMEPEGLYPLLLRVWSHYKKPIIITENGVADSRDVYRRWWLEETIVAMQRAISEGVQVKGYLHWSLLDNFEWKYGWWPKFGLIEVDREDDMRRTIRPSARWFAERIQNLK
jgi:beta-glucosidase